ncbi:MAG: 1-(5-phosphoribosyl)-5-[(5-phosphoribosylamino)methylideneamino]imidazole-4-carboxamide isomerase [Chloroflexi bacterium]|nr:1-(5-phosphoribosyl)-5-[(5-phosphoribosylamino)methylideneamino]imidazole-4-carboxamide isomerase [Dehalococcoidia bacterium]MCO5201101.1 1-(5-phosphoribosyl)-5-[(5-phosphoribosylamino)methylideneamino]imidazole-4-carboxamide isomerase [Chloroflexota bacterium]MCZ7578779.1 1-(5-phosphoribosyl)-5-[(5-phosphoribosylamino)methylideneamino]imidazole-4-carboxamide isomerase [Dehalococcoidia bacterium]NJD64159.1 1-(5-phosphoribosyl)-5-[(5-phosphoribosylamino)methylideneamino]imidazole-4-carboxamide
MSFEVIPAIDLRGGRCVRLLQGDYDRETAYSGDPVAVAERWAALGAPRLHVVDLDGAKEGAPRNQEVMAAICQAVAIPVEVSGGIRSIGAIAAALAYGATRVQLGSVAIKDPALTRQAIARFGEAIVIAIDAKDGEVRTDGWLQGSNVRAIDLARELAAAGVARLMFTDIGRDGMLTEPNFGAYRELLAAVNCPVVASGGVSKVDHLVRLAEIGCEGAIVGKSLYEAAFTLPEALQAVATQ